MITVQMLYNIFNKNKIEQTPQMVEVFNSGVSSRVNIRLNGKLYNNKEFIPGANKTSKAFTLIELLVVIAIIGVLSTLVIVSLGNSRAKARDSKRLNDMRSMANALELYYANNNQYPSSITPGQTLEAGGIVYISKVPNNPTPRTDGGCPDSDYSYSVNASGTSYAMGFCLGSSAGSFSAGVNVVYPGGNSSAGLLGWFKLDEVSGSAVINSGSHGTQGVMYTDSSTIGSIHTSTDCAVGQSCALFNGTGSTRWINTSLANTLGSSGDFTITSLFRSGNISSPQAIFSYGYGGHTWGRFWVGVASNKPQAVIYTGSQYIFITGGANLSSNQWYFVSAVYSRSEGKIKVFLNNAIELASADWNGQIESQAGHDSRVIGGQRQSSNAIINPFNGRIDEVRIYERALSEEEIKALYQSYGI